MITADGYSKDPTIMPEGIVVTFGQDMIKRHGSYRQFIRYFEDHMMADEDNMWLHKCKNKPQQDIIYVYVIVCNRLKYKLTYGGHYTDPIEGGRADGTRDIFAWPRITLAGPLEKCPFKRILKGFQGFRYCTKLF